MIGSAEKKKIEQDTRDQMRYFAKQSAVENDGIIKRYYSELSKCNDEDKAIAVVCEAFSCGKTKVRNQIAKSTGNLNPVTKSLNEARLLVHMGKLETQIFDFMECLNRQLEDLEEQEDEWVKVEQTDSERSGETTKKIAKNEMTRKLLREGIEAQQEYFKAVKSLVPQSVINQTFDNRRVDEYDTEDLYNQVVESMDGEVDAEQVQKS